jgi:transglutaminase-like putative cysteine protease
MHLDIRFVTHFVYPTPVWESQNAVRASPIDTEDQQLLSYSLEVEPAVETQWYVDRWGTRVDTFGVLDPHTELIVTATASVETSAPAGPPGGATVLDVYDETRDGHLSLFLRSSRHTEWGGPIVDAAADVVAGSSDLDSAVRDIMAIVNRRLDYRPGATEIGDKPEDVWAQQAGVCQDYAHLMVAMLRSQGIPARYVSGYFYATDVSVGGTPETSEITVKTHAWAEVWVPGFGWWGIDPTNDQVAGERHVVVGQGRDYDDVLPMRGVYYGDTDHELAAHVVMSASGLGAMTVPQVDLGHEGGVDQ